jgi:copper chaperone
MLQIVPKPEQGPESAAPQAQPQVHTQGQAQGQVQTQNDADAVQAIYKVSGMSCGHCATAVTEELTSIAGVASVQVDIAAGTVTVQSAQALAEPDVRAAIDEAGYELV